MSFELLAIDLGILGGEYVYRRWFAAQPAKPSPVREFSIPRTDEGAPIPQIVGRCRVMAPVLAWTGTPDAIDISDSAYDALRAIIGQAPFLYGLNMYFVLGVPFQNGINRVYQLYAGDELVPFDLISTGVDAQTLTGDTPTSDAVGNTLGPQCEPLDRKFGGINIGGGLEFLNGNSNQTLVDGSGLATSIAGYLMLNDSSTPAAQIPSFRGYMSVMLFGGSLGLPANIPPWGTFSLPWCVGTAPQIPNYSFEASSYPGTGPLALPPIGAEANPASWLYDLLTGGLFGKASLDPSMIDVPSFLAAGATLAAEGNGYSRSIETSDTGENLASEVLTQIDGTLREDPITGLVSLKLIRADYDYATLPEINPDNCESLTYAAGGWTDLPNKVQIGFTNRQLNYQPGKSTSINQANAVGQDGVVTELVIQMPGVCTQANADAICAREISALSRPMARATAVCNREVAGLLQGDPVKLRWPEHHASGLVFRVASITRGTLSDGRVTIELIQDFFFVWRGVVGSGANLGGLNSFGLT